MIESGTQYARWLKSIANFHREKDILFTAENDDLFAWYAWYLAEINYCEFLKYVRKHEDQLTPARKALCAKVFRQVRAEGGLLV